MTGRTVVYALFFYSCEQIDVTCLCEETTLESISYGQTRLSPYRKTFLAICETLTKFTLAANVPQNAYIDTSLPRWS